jgi:hypothetical protein
VSRKRNEKFYLLKSDDDAKDSIFLIYPTSNFVPLDVWREMRINKII